VLSWLDVTLRAKSSTKTEFRAQSGQCNLKCQSTCRAQNDRPGTDVQRFRASFGRRSLQLQSQSQSPGSLVQSDHSASWRIHSQSLKPVVQLALHGGFFPAGRCWGR
jgi:hypothetical protein